MNEPKEHVCGGMINGQFVSFAQLVEQNRAMVTTMLNIHDFAKVVSLNLMKVKEKLTDEEIRRIGPDFFPLVHLRQVESERATIDAQLKAYENAPMQQIQFANDLIKG